MERIHLTYVSVIYSLRVTGERSFRNPITLSTDLFVRDALPECWAWPYFGRCSLGSEIARRQHFVRRHSIRTNAFLISSVEIS